MSDLVTSNEGKALRKQIWKDILEALTERNPDIETLLV